MGFVGASGAGMTVAYERGIEGLLAANPGKIDWVASCTAPYGTASWAVEIGKLKQCDFIINCLFGSMLSSFTRDARYRGYEGSIITGMEGYPAFWDLVTAALPPDELYSLYFAFWQPWWNESVPFIVDLKERVQQYFPDEYDYLTSQPGPITGWSVGLVLGGAIRRAVDEVGVEGLNSDAIRDALLQTDMQMVDQGWGNNWKFEPDYRVLWKKQRVFNWEMADQEWTAITDWFLPASVPD